jgi:hypothetical protein
MRGPGWRPEDLARSLRGKGIGHNSGRCEMVSEKGTSRTGRSLQPAMKKVARLRDQSHGDSAPATFKAGPSPSIS